MPESSQRPHGKTQLHRHYSKGLKLARFNLHHMHPSSCGGGTHEFNLFPYKTKCHSSWHTLFLNMKIWDVWEKLNEIYDLIFNTDDEFISRPWLSICELSSKVDLQNQTDKEYRTEDLQEHWICAFGGQGLAQTRTLLKYMMLFMIFGSDMANIKQLLDNGHLSDFFEKFPVEGERKWAFITCFGVNAGWQTIKSRTSKIARQSL